MAEAERKFFDLKDERGARIKAAHIDNTLYLLITKLGRDDPRWDRCVNEIGFRPSKSGTFLVREVKTGERIQTSWFSQVFPNVVLRSMHQDEFIVRIRQAAPVIRPETPSQEELDRVKENREVKAEVDTAVLLGRNAEGDQVLEGTFGRKIRRANGTEIMESDLINPALFLRARDNAALDLCADGFVTGMAMGEAQHSEDMARFITAVSGQESGSEGIDVWRARVQEAVESAMLRRLKVAHETPQEAYAEAVHLYEHLPPYVGEERGAGAMPLPVAIATQRMLGDTKDLTVSVPHAYDGSAFAFLSPESKILAGSGGKDLSGRTSHMFNNVQWGDNSDGRVDRSFINFDKVDEVAIGREVRRLRENGRAVLVLPADDSRQPGLIAGSSRFTDWLYKNFTVIDAFDTDSSMTIRAGTRSALRVINIVNRKPQIGEDQAPEKLPVVYGWEDLKGRIDEAIRISDIKEAESESLAIERAKENVLQSPYMAKSMVGEARAMVPKNLQAATAEALTDLEAEKGAIDQFVMDELMVGRETLEERYTPEQIDSIALGIRKLQRRQGYIIGDETGLGKGRQLGALAAWARKHNMPVIFMTDKPNLFSDFHSRDLVDIDEATLFRPLVVNSEGHIIDMMGDGGLLHKGARPSEMKQILAEGRSVSELGANIIYCTYSQINSEDSAKAAWLAEQARGAIVIADEAHVAAGGDSNMSAAMESILSNAVGVVYSSATWLKGARNINLYGRAMPSAVNVDSLTETMNRGGESFSEIFSSMLARDGALIRREHDLSKLTFELVSDEGRRERNERYADSISEILGKISYVSGDLEKIMHRINAQTREALNAARNSQVAAISKKKVNLLRSGFNAGTAIYQIMRRLDVSINVEQACEIAIKEFNEGKKPLIVFDDTFESLARTALDEGVELQDGSMVVRQVTFKDVLRRLISGLGVVHVKEIKAQALLKDRIVKMEKERERRIKVALRDYPKTATILDLPREVREQIENFRWDDLPQDENPDASGDAAEAVLPEAPESVVEMDSSELTEASDAAPSPRAQSASSGITEAQMEQFAGMEVELNLRDGVEFDGVTAAQKKAFLDGIQEIENLIKDLPDIPASPIDIAHHRLQSAGLVGQIPDAHAEITGRGYLFTPKEDGLLVGRRRDNSKQAVMRTARAFNNGDLDYIIINRSAATGISLHSSPRFRDQRQRVMVEAQIPNDVTARMQLFGRANRWDQVTPPRIITSSTGLYATLRQAMMSNNHLRRLSANVRSNRENAFDDDTVPDLLNKVGNEVCMDYLRDNPGIASRMCIRESQLNNPGFRAAEFLTSRAPLLSSTEQKTVYADIYNAFNDRILMYELEGANPLKPAEHDLRAKIVRRDVLFGQESGGESAFDSPVYMTKIEYEKVHRPYTWDEVVKMIREGREALVESGRAKLVDQMDAENVPQVDFSATIQTVQRLMTNLATIALRSSDFENMEKALQAKYGPVERALQRSQFFQDNLPSLVPGAAIYFRAEDFFSTPDDGVVVGLKTPRKGKEHMLSEWGVRVVFPNVSEVKEYSLGALFEKKRLVVQHPNMLQENELVDDEGYSREFRDPEGYKRRGAEARRNLFKANLLRAPKGSVTYTSNILEGNMYLASEWTAATKAGAAGVFTDADGVRHRGIFLKRSFSLTNIDRMPLRLSRDGHLARFIRALQDNQIRELVVAKTFKAASEVPLLSKDTIKFSENGEKLYFYCSKEFMKRMSRKLSLAKRAVHADGSKIYDMHVDTLRGARGSGVSCYMFDLRGQRRINDTVRFIKREMGTEIYIQGEEGFGSAPVAFSDSPRNHARHVAREILGGPATMPEVTAQASSDAEGPEEDVGHDAPGVPEQRVQPDLPVERNAA